MHGINNGVIGSIATFDAIRIILICVCIAAALCMMCCMLMMRRAAKLTVRRISKEAQRGGVCRFVHISDIHIRRMIIPWRNIIETVRDEMPEFVVITGDLCNTRAETARAVSFISALADNLRLPIYITFGNHDNAICAEPQLRAQYIRLLEDCSPFVKVLDNTSTFTPTGAVIGGLDDIHHNSLINDSVHTASSKHKHKDKQNTAIQNNPIANMVCRWSDFADERRTPYVLATHNADILQNIGELAPEKRPDIVICGHTHGGQVRTPWNLEFKLLRKDKLPKKGIYYGEHSFMGFDLYITSGIGCSLMPVRYKSNAEIVSITIGA